MKYRITKADKKLVGTINLEGSKSITNRVLMIKAMCPDDFEVHNFSRSNDSRILLDLINSNEKILRAGDGGTTLRFMLSYLAIHQGEVILTGSERLIQRPIGPLVDALKSVGADIEYLGAPGCPPVLINGKLLDENRVSVDASISSQFISSLLLIAPLLKDGMVLMLKGDIVSSSYIKMTLDVMKHFGITSDWTQNVISIRHQEYSGRKITVEGDWSSASYLYEMAALADEVDLKIIGLNKISVQGDSVVKDLMLNFGVHTEYIDGGVHLTKGEATNRTLDYDFKDCPDIAQTMLATCAGLNKPAKIRGVENLEIKETDRMAAMQAELDKVGAKLIPLGNTWNLGLSETETLKVTQSFKTYGDHRMAMAMTPLALTLGSVIIEDPEVVAKSYPQFWNDIKLLGFEIEEMP